MSAPETLFQHNPTRQAALVTMRTAVTQHPYMIYGENGYCTELMTHMGGAVLGKRGAGGVYMTGLVGKGVGCAVKIDSGAMGPQYCVAQQFLQWYHQNSPDCFCPLGQGQGQERTAAETLEKDYTVTELPLPLPAPLQPSVCMQCTQRLARLDSYRDVPLYNAMSLLIGHMKCHEDILTLDTKINIEGEKTTGK
jgi:hypothetical protein